MREQDFYDALEVRSQDERHAAQMKALAGQVARARHATPYFHRLFADAADEPIDSLEHLAALPVTRKSKLTALQQEEPPFAGMAATEPEELRHLFISPGPIADPGGRAENWFRMARAFFAAGIRKGDRVLNCFSYHHTPAGAMMETAANSLGCPVYPGGTGQVEAQIQAVRHFRLSAYVGTPDFLQVVLDAASERGVALESVTKASVGGGALFPAMRDKYAEQGINVTQSYGTADLGLIAYESPALEGMLLDEDVIVEIVRPGTGDPVPSGEVGEVVVTTLNHDYPLIRFATGDLSATLAGMSPCGRTSPRIKGWMGRADQTTKVRGMFVHPEQVAELTTRHPAIRRARLVVTHADGKDSMQLRYESEATIDAAALEADIRECLKLRGTAEHAETGSLPNDGIVIEDARDYE